MRLWNAFMKWQASLSVEAHVILLRLPVLLLVIIGAIAMLLSDPEVQKRHQEAQQTSEASK